MLSYFYIIYIFFVISTIISKYTLGFMIEFKYIFNKKMLLSNLIYLIIFKINSCTHNSDHFDSHYYSCCYQVVTIDVLLRSGA